MIKTYQLKTKHFTMQILKNGEPVGHPIFIKKGILRQIWEDYLYPLMFVIIGIIIGVIFD